MTSAIEQIKKLRENTGAGIMECRKALQQANGSEEKARDLLRIWGSERSEKKKDRATRAGVVETYVHAGGKVGAMLELLCETDFVAKTDEFKHLAHEICLQIASMDPDTPDALLKQAWIRDARQTIKDVVSQTIGKLGENIRIGKFCRYSLDG